MIWAMAVVGIFSNPAIPKGENTMSRTISLTGFALAFLCMSVSVPIVRAQAPRPALIWDVCWAGGADIPVPDQMAQAVFYVSGALPLFSIADYQDVPRAFARFILAKYPFPPGMTPTAQCGQVQSLAEALSFLKQFGTTPAFGAPNCKRAKCIMTDWTTPERAAAEVAAAPGSCNSGLCGWQ
jgi:hypothetical protein